MTNALYKKEHFNLYYIFKEDKEQNLLPPMTVRDLWNRLSSQIDLEESP